MAENGSSDFPKVLPGKSQFGYGILRGFARRLINLDIPFTHCCARSSYESSRPLYSSRYWEEITLALIGQQFLGVPDGEIVGAVLSVRYSEDILGIWNRSAGDRDYIEKIRDAIKKILQLPPHANMEYKPHQNSMADRSSFRNTQVWKPKSLEGRGAPHLSEARRSGSWTERDERKTSKPHSRDNTGTGRWR